MNTTFVDRRKNRIQRNLVILGNHLSMWAGIPATTPEEKQRLANLLEAWDETLNTLRTEVQNNLLPNSAHSDIL
jgi:hypothetical protein